MIDEESDDRQMTDRQTDESKKDDKNEAVVNFYEEKHIDILFYHSNNNNKDGHTALIDARKLLKKKRSQKNSILCRVCFQFIKSSQFCLHATTCSEYQLKIFPEVEQDGEGELDYPLLNKNSIRGRDPISFGMCFDLEASFAKEQNGEKKMSASMALIQAFYISEPTSDDLPIVKNLKSLPFQTKVRVGVNCIEQMLQDMLRLGQEILARIRTISKHYDKYYISPEQKRELFNIKHCSYCSKPFSKTRFSVYHHTHMEAEDPTKLPKRNLRGARGRFVKKICVFCNNQTWARIQREIPIWAHNFSFYDCGFLIHKLLECHNNGRPIMKNISIIPQSSEKIIQMRIQGFCGYCMIQKDDLSIEMKKKKGKNGRMRSVYCQHQPTYVFKDSLRLCPKSLGSLIDEFSSVEGETLEQTFEFAYHFYKRKGYLDYLTMSDIIKKIPFCYSFWEDNSNFLELTDLPSYERWNEKDPITREQWVEAKKIWDKLVLFAQNKLKTTMTMALFATLYLENDVYLLISILKKIINSYFNYFSLDLAQFPTIASYSWACFLKNLKEEIHVITSPYIFELFSANLNGGLVNCSSHYAKSNILGKPGYDCTKPQQELLFFDGVSLYPSMGSKYALCARHYEAWGPQKSELYFHKMITQSIYSQWTDNCAFVSESGAPIGLALVCDLSMTEEQQNLYQSFPIFWGKKNVSLTDLSPVQQNLCKLNKVNPSSTPRLLLHVGEVQDFLVDWRVLLFYIKLGIKIHRVSEIISFEVSYYMRSTIDYNAQVRKSAKFSYEKATFKILSSILFGKLQSTGSKQVDCKIVLSKTGLEKHVLSPTFQSFSNLSKNETVLYGLSMFRKQKLYTRKTLVSAAFQVLQLAKISVFNFFYNMIRPIYRPLGCHVTSLYGDTDSILFLVQAPSGGTYGPLSNSSSLVSSRAPEGLSRFNAWGELIRIISHLDISSLDQDHPIFYGRSPEETLVLEKIRKENKKKLNCYAPDVSSHIVEYIGHRSKVYSLLLEKGKPKMRCKGVNLQKVDIKHERFKDFLFGRTKNCSIQQRVFISKRHEKFIKCFHKKAFSLLNLKRVEFGKNMSYPFYHHLLPYVRVVYQVLQEILDQL